MQHRPRLLLHLAAAADFDGDSLTADVDGEGFLSQSNQSIEVPASIPGIEFGPSIGSHFDDLAIEHS